MNKDADSRTPYTDQAPPNVKIGANGYNLYAYQIFDECVIVDPARGTMSLVEDIRPQW